MWSGHPVSQNVGKGVEKLFFWPPFLAHLTRKKLVDLGESGSHGATDGALVAGAFLRVAAHGTDIEVAGDGGRIGKGLLVEVGVHFFNLVDHIEILGDAILAFFLGVGDHLRIHLGELVGFAFDGGLEVGGGVADLSGIAEVGMGMDGFSFGGCAEQLGNLTL